MSDRTQHPFGGIVRVDFDISYYSNAVHMYLSTIE